MYKHLTREQRYAIYPGKQKKQTNKAIARLIGVSESTVSRELKRNATKNGKYVRTRPMPFPKNACTVLRATVP